MSDRTCRWPGCDAVVARKWCPTHGVMVRPRAQGSRTKVCLIADCSRLVRARDLCATHYNDARRRAGMDDREVRNGDAKLRAESLRVKSRFRKAIVTAPDAEAIDIWTLADRDAWICGICGEPVDKALRYPDRMAPTIDHILPISHGGRHRWSNVQLSHFACNMAKGDAVA